MLSPHPGTILLEQYLTPKKTSQNRLANTIGVPPRRINEIILGKRAITADTAVRLAEYFGNSASYWMHLQAEYDIQRAREKIASQLARIQPIYRDETRLNTATTVAIKPVPRKKIKRRIMR
jgi:addiction module HigA family antidote